MRKPILAVLVLMAFASALLFAQTTSHPSPPTPAMRAQHQVGFLTTVLSLTSAQQQQATTIFTNAATAEDGVRSNMKAAHETLHNAVKANDAAAIDQAAAGIGNLTAQSTSIHAKAHAAFYQLLTPEQQSKMGQLDLHRMHGGMMMRGPMAGGHMGPPPE